MARNKSGHTLLLIMTLLLLTALACSLPVMGDGGLSNSDSPDADPAQENSGQGLHCEQEGYPCTIAELSGPVLAHNQQVMTDALHMLEQGQSLDEVARALSSEENMAEVQHDDFALFFRLENSLPVWVFHPEKVGTNRGAPDMPRISSPGPSAVEDKPDGPVGPQPQGSEPKKQALILSPYLWDFKADETDMLARTLAEHRNYDCAGCINLQQQSERPVLDPNHPLGALDRLGDAMQLYTTWEEYELIHLSTHGGQACSGGEAGQDGERASAFVDLSRSSSTRSSCQTGILTGTFWYEALFEALEPEDIDAGHPLATPGVTLAVVGSRPGMGLVGDFVLTADFFEHHYPEGLDDKIIFFSSCKSFEDKDFMHALRGENTTLFGWDDNVRNDAAKEISETFYDYLINQGLQAKSAFQKTVSHGGYSVGFDQAGANLMGGGFPEIRGREVITMLHPAWRTPLQEEATTVTDSRSVVNDLQEDRILFAALVEGIDDNQNPAEYTVHVSVDGIEADKTFTPSLPMGENSYLAQGIVPLERDLDNEKVVSLETWVELPAGGETRHRLEVVKPIACGWHGELIGPMAGSYSGQISDFVQVFNSIGPALDITGRSGGGAMPTLTEDQLENLPHRSAWLLSFNQPDEMMGAVFSSFQDGSMGMLMPPEEEQVSYVSENITYQETRETEQVIEGKFSGSFYGIKITSGGFSQVEGPELQGEFTWHVESQCNMDLALLLVDNYKDTYGGLP